MLPSRPVITAPAGHCMTNAVPLGKVSRTGLVPVPGPPNGWRQLTCTRLKKFPENSPAIPVATMLAGQSSVTGLNVNPTPDVMVTVSLTVPVKPPVAMLIAAAVTARQRTWNRLMTVPGPSPAMMPVATEPSGNRA